MFQPLIAGKPSDGDLAVLSLQQISLKVIRKNMNKLHKMCINYSRRGYCTILDIRIVEDILQGCGSRGSLSEYLRSLSYIR